jgi:hypothetical protein
MTEELVPFHGIKQPPVENKDDKTLPEGGTPQVIKDFSDAIITSLQAPDAMIAQYDPTKGRTGTVQFIVVQHGERFIALSALDQQTNNPNAVEIQYVDRAAKTVGQIILAQDRARQTPPRLTGKIVSADDNRIQRWLESGGVPSWVPDVTQRALSANDFSKLTAALTQGLVNLELTNRSLAVLGEQWGARRIEQKVRKGLPSSQDSKGLGK